MRGISPLGSGERGEREDKEGVVRILEKYRHVLRGIFGRLWLMKNFFLFLNETLTLQKTGSSDNFDFEKRCRISKLKSRVKLIVRLQKRSKEQSPIVYLFIHQLNLCCALVISGYWYNIFFC